VLEERYHQVDGIGTSSSTAASASVSILGELSIRENEQQPESHEDTGSAQEL